MSMTASVTKAHSLGGVDFPEGQSINGDGAIVHDIVTDLAWAGSLTTRTDDDEGTITLDDSDHVVTTGMRVDLYWDGGSRRGCTVGTVAGNAVPFSGGAGDNLPTEDSDIIIGIPTELDIQVDGDNVLAVLLYLSLRGQFTFTDSGNVEKFNQVIGAEQAFDWNKNSGVVNPLAGDTIAKVFVSSADPETQATARVGVLYNND